MEHDKLLLLVNFGGPRTLDEVEPFLVSLLTDQDVVRTNLFPLLHRFLFTRIAKKRTLKVRPEYESMGGGSPIYQETEAVSKALSQVLKCPSLTFHRYLPETHAAFISEIEAFQGSQIRVLPLFPQFSYATTGSIARFFEKKLSAKTLRKIKWVRSYAENEHYIEAQRRKIAEFLQQKNLDPERVLLLFSAHGVPQKFIESGDLYLEECQRCFDAIRSFFPQTRAALSFQSRFGPDEWLKPYTSDVVKNIREHTLDRDIVVFIPISFTSDQIETLVEVEKDYMSVVRDHGLTALRVPALGLEPYWIDAMTSIWQEAPLSNNTMLIRQKGCKERCPSCKSRCRF